MGREALAADQVGLLWTALGIGGLAGAFTQAVSAQLLGPVLS